MKRTYIFGTMLAATLTLPLSAMSQQSSADQSSSQSQRNEVTVTGCLMAGAGGAGSTAGTTGTSGSTSASSASGGFMLMNAIVSSGGSSTAGSTAGGSTVGGSTTAGTTGSANSASGSKTGSTYTLTGGQKSELEKYVNSKVEVRGRLDSSSSGAGSSAAGSTTAGSGSTASGSTGSAGSGSSSASGMTGPAQQLHVTSVRQLSSTCSGQ
jgi:hypothetical protein